jgi:hypothetical protein
MNWLKVYWKDGGFRLMTHCLLVGSVVLQLMIYGVDYLKNPYEVIWIPWVVLGMIAFYLVIVLPIAYFKRNSP